MTHISGTVADVLDGLRTAGYLADTTIGTVVCLAAELGKPVLVDQLLQLQLHQAPRQPA